MGCRIAKLAGCHRRRNERAHRVTGDDRLVGAEMVEHRDEVMRVGQSILTADDVLDGVAGLVGTVKIECLFGDGMRILHVEGAIGPGRPALPPARRT